jgi:hypothetical protein
MSRSNPTANRRNPSTRHFEWSSANKCVRYFDREKEKEVQLKLPFRFIFLDELSTVTGYNPRMKSGIYANEVYDTRVHRFVVKYFKAGLLAEGFWTEIKDKVNAAKGGFAKNVYLAYLGSDKKLHLGSFMFSGAARSAWLEFTKKNKRTIEQEPVAVLITGSKAGVNGDVEFNEPVFGIEPIKPETVEATMAAAVALDKELQEFLKEYMSRTSSTSGAPVAHPAENPQPDPVDDIPPDDEVPPGTPVDDDADPSWT